jgi:hypothetical protein
MPLEYRTVRFAADWDCSGVLRQTPGGRGVWDSFYFTTELEPEYDYLIVFNNRRLDPVQVWCARQHVWCVIQEPYEPRLYDWMVEGHDAFSRVFTHYLPSVDPKYVRSYPIPPWGLESSFDQLQIRGAGQDSSRLVDREQSEGFAGTAQASSTARVPDTREAQSGGSLQTGNPVYQG